MSQLLSDVNQLKSTLKDSNTVALFFADWCGHCQKFAPEFEKLASANGGELQFVRNDFSASRDNLDAEHQVLDSLVTSYPTLIGFKQNQPNVGYRFTANRDDESLAQFLSFMKK